MRDPHARFMDAVATAATEHLGKDHPLCAAALKAATDPAPEHGVAVQSQLDALSFECRDAILAQAHKIMREDLAAIWSHLPAASPDDTMH